MSITSTTVKIVVSMLLVAALVATSLNKVSQSSETLPYPTKH